MSQRPVGISRVQRPRTPPPVPPQRHTGPGNGIPWAGRVGWLGYGKAHENRPDTETATPTGGESVPDVQVCRMCRARVDDPAWHEEWHANLNAWAQRIEAEQARMLEFCQRLGYVPNGGDSAATDEDSEDGR